MGRHLARTGYVSLFRLSERSRCNFPSRVCLMNDGGPTVDGRTKVLYISLYCACVGFDHIFKLPG